MGVSWLINDCTCNKLSVLHGLLLSLVVLRVIGFTRLSCCSCCRIHSSASVREELEQLAFPSYAMKNDDASTVFKGLDADFPCVIRA